MPKQTGIIKLKGTIGGISFYKTSDGHLAREKGGVDANRIANDPAFQRTRENGSEFGRAGKGGKVLRDTTNDRGLRTIQDGDLNLLEGFEFNLNGKLGATLFAAFTKDFDRVSGDATLNIAAFSPTVRIAAPVGTTHFKVVMGASELDFVNETSTFENDETAILPYSAADTAPIALTAALTANSTLPVVQILGVEFYQEVNGQMYVLKNGAYNALSVVTIDTP